MSSRLRVSFPFAVHLTLVFSAAAAVFLLLRTSDYLAVDGALRALEVYQRGVPFLHPNHHLLYAVNVYAWSVLLRLLGIHPDSPYSFLTAVEAMNAISAAACVTILYGLTYKLTNRAVIAAFVAAGLALSRAFVAHATNSSEPMVGMFWSAVSVVSALYGLAAGKRWACVTAGLMLALTMATYQSMTLIGAPLIWLFWRWPGSQGEYRPLRDRLSSVMRFAAGFAVGVVIIFGTAYYLAGTRTPTELVNRFLMLDPYLKLEGGINLVRTASVLAGFAYALFPCLPRECTGFRCLSAAEHQSWIPVAGLAIVLAGLSLIAMLVLGKRLWALMGASEKLAIACCCIGLASTAMPLLWYTPTYDKLWLLPLACLYLCAGVIANAALRGADTGLGRVGRLTVPSSCAFRALMLPSNLLRIARTGPSPSLTEATEVAQLVKPQDLLVGDWNDVFLLYQAFWAAQANSFNVPTQALHIGSRTMARLGNTARQTRERGGEVFFLGLLDLSEHEWKESLGDNRGLPYADFDRYRRCADTVESFQCQGRLITLRRLVPDCVIQSAGPVRDRPL